MKYLISISLGLVIVVTSSCSLVKYTIDHAPYTVLKSDDKFEVRHYESMLLVSTSMTENNSGKGEDNSFRKLFNYISGENSAQQDIAMTAPVFMDERKSQTMSFVLPRDFSIENSPKPTNEEVSLEKIDDYTVAVIRFSGWLDDETISERKDELTKWISQQRYQIEGPTLIAGYDPPSSIPFFRRNEVLIPIGFPESIGPEQQN